MVGEGEEEGMNQLTVIRFLFVSIRQPHFSTIEILRISCGDLRVLHECSIQTYMEVGQDA